MNAVCLILCSIESRQEIITGLRAKCSSFGKKSYKTTDNSSKTTSIIEISDYQIFILPLLTLMNLWNLSIYQQRGTWLAKSWKNKIESYWQLEASIFLHSNSKVILKQVNNWQIMIQLNMTSNVYRECYWVF
jgi:hypothetical protein